MNFSKRPLYILYLVFVTATGCKSLNVQTATALGTTGGEAFGEVFGKASGNETAGAIIGASLGEVTGSVIGFKMDKQASDIKKDVASAKVNRVGEGIVIEFNDKILFPSNRSNLTTAAEQDLDGLVTIFNRYPDTHLEIHGHTDDKGSDSFNQLLSRQRASAVANYLQQKGIDSNRISIKALGKAMPKYDNSSEKGRKQNRRVEILISEK